MIQWRPVALASILLAAARPSGAQIIRESRERIDTLRMLAHRDSCDATVYHALAIALLSRDERFAADSAFQRATVIDPQLAEAWLGLGVVETSNDDYWKALRRQDAGAVDREHRRREALVRRAFMVDPFLDVRMLVSDSYDAVYRWSSRLLAAEVASHHSLDSVPPGLLWMHALAGARTFHLAQAVSDLQTLLRVGQRYQDSVPGAPLRLNELRYMLAAVFQRSGNATEAQALYRDVLTNDLGNYMAHVQLARIAEREGDSTTSLRERQAAVETNPDDYVLLTDLAVALSRVDRWAEAETSLLQARRMGSCTTRALYWLGVVQQHLGKSAEARRSLETYLLVAPRGQRTPIEDARNRLAQLPQ